MPKKEKTPVLLTPSSGVFCKTCRHYKDNTEPGDDDQTGECLRYPPVMLWSEENGPVRTFPIVEAKEHCGEHAPVLN